jgi:hypothetical protein
VLTLVLPQVADAADFVTVRCEDVTVAGTATDTSSNSEDSKVEKIKKLLFPEFLV